MKINNVKNLKIAHKYANALFQSAIESGLGNKIRDDLIFIVETINSNSKLAEVIQSPVIKNDDKKDIIKKIFEPHIEKTTLDFLYLLIDNSRINAINEILNSYSDLYNSEYNIALVNVISAVELTMGQKARIIEKLENKINKKLNPEYIINPEIIGGLIIEIGDKTIDCSLKTKFNN
ncbi:MAG: ATP synthase F1 subunit delta, partial [Candidatus Gastranaerophilales bacterium]|nr:ATP synthase F1 subunit delta [Candidatus Gastranaerophilales bacterium]